jgi:hypothetical protein
VADKATATSIPTIRSINTDVASNLPSPPGTIPIVRNRLAIIDVTLAEGLFANENPVGRLVQYGADSGTADSKPMVIVGLAPAVKHDLFKNRPEAHLYVPSGAADSTRMFVYARAAAPQTGDAIVRSAREQVRAAAANLPVPS